MAGLCLGALHLYLMIEPRVWGAQVHVATVASIACTVGAVAVGRGRRADFTQKVPSIGKSYSLKPRCVC